MLAVLQSCFTCLGKSKDTFGKPKNWRQIYPEEQSMNDIFEAYAYNPVNFTNAYLLFPFRTEGDMLMTASLAKIHTSTDDGTRESEKAARYYTLNTEEIAYSLLTPCEMREEEEENDRLHEQHWILKELRKESIPLLRVMRTLNAGDYILDALCGPGTYVMDLAVEIPRCRVVGADTTAAFPKDVKPRNAKFVQVDSYYDLPFTNNKFAFINVQPKLMSLSINNIYKVLGEFARLCKVGGYIYFMVPDLEHDYADKIVNNYLRMLREALRATGGTPSIRHCLETFLAMRELCITEHRLIYQIMGKYQHINNQILMMILTWFNLDDTTKFGKVAKTNYERWAHTIGPHLGPVLDMDPKRFQTFTEETMKHFIDKKLAFLCSEAHIGDGNRPSANPPASKFIHALEARHLLPHHHNWQRPPVVGFRIHLPDPLHPLLSAWSCLYPYLRSRMHRSMLSTHQPLHPDR
ncbi:hypothetical protein INT43_001006 [Umbelopsis isabellina]|uniref:Methyltransferase domain-containing protein n=1 Tax=Mortierella isabellina TaxID=91625 RepID=A0A8H7UMD1_MORIS|nr:hypothetical protein INT43_001006 [Umbelopsis isabellina]